MQPACRPAPPPATRAPGTVRLARQPIVDRHRNLVGFELFHLGAAGGPGYGGIGARWTAELVSDVFASVGVEQVLGAFTGYVNVDAEFIGSRLVEVLPPGKIRLELGDSIGGTAETVGRCEALRKLGYGLVADNYWGDRERITPLLPFIDAIKVDLDWVGPEHLGAVVRPYGNGRKVLIAEKVESAEQFAHARAHGFDLFQGYHFALPERLEARRAGADLPALLRLINHVVADAELPVIEEEFKRQPSMTVNLLRIANSAAAGSRVRVGSLREALMRMGRRPLQAWLQLLVYTAGGNGPSPLLHTAALRGKLMELAAGVIRPDDPAFRDRALMVGLLSLMHVVFGRTQAEFAVELALDDDLRAALECRAGPLGALLREVEGREAAATGPATGATSLDAATFNRLEMQAFAWATGVVLPG